MAVIATAGQTYDSRVFAPYQRNDALSFTGAVGQQTTINAAYYTAGDNDGAVNDLWTTNVPEASISADGLLTVTPTATLASGTYWWQLVNSKGTWQETFTWEVTALANGASFTILPAQIGVGGFGTKAIPRSFSPAWPAT